MPHVNFCSAELCTTPVPLGKDYCQDHREEVNYLV